MNPPPSFGDLPMLVLASGSPRRADLLGRLGLPFTAKPADIDESVFDHLPPAQMARSLSQEKAKRVWQTGGWVLAADTVVALGDTVLGKPSDLEENKRFLHTLSAQTHTVYTGVSIINPKAELHSAVAEAEVTFRRLEGWEIEWYAASGEGLDKAGGYGAQGLGMVLLECIDGDFYTVMGLPVSRVWERLKDLGYFGEAR